MFRRSWFASAADNNSCVRVYPTGHLWLENSLDEFPFGNCQAAAQLPILIAMITKNIGMLLLAIYLIIVGIVTLTGFGIGFITGAIALVAGIFILIGR